MGIVTGTLADIRGFLLIVTFPLKVLIQEKSQLSNVPELGLVLYSDSSMARGLSPNRTRTVCGADLSRIRA
jgi:hypothetical protein